MKVSEDHYHKGMYFLKMKILNLNQNPNLNPNRSQGVVQGLKHNN